MTRATNTEIISISIDPLTIEAVDKITEVRGFDSRSALVEFALKKFILEVIKDGKV